jgi:hypothetical protein
VPEAVANRPRVAGVVPGDKKVVEVDTDADDDGEGDPAESGQQVRPGVEAGSEADGDREEEMVSRVDGKSLRSRFGDDTYTDCRTPVPPVP